MLQLNIPYGLNGCLQTDIYNYHNFFLVLDKYVS